MSFMLLLVLIALVVLILLGLLRPRPSPAPEVPRAVPDTLSPKALEPMLAARFAGKPADGSRASAGEHAAVIWVDAGDEVIVHLNSLRSTIVDSALLMAIDLETDDTGRQTLVVPFALGSDADGGTTFVTEALPRGHEALVRRWGEHVQQAAYAALLDLAATHAAERGGVPRALYLKGAALHFAARTSE